MPVQTTSEPMRVRFRRPTLYPKQERALYNDARYSVVEASTKSGKTHGAIVWLFEQAVMTGRPGRNYWWVAPVTQQAKIAYRRLKRAIPEQLRSCNESELFIQLNNGAILSFKGSDRPDSLYGDDVKAAVIDEASRCREAAWHAVRSTLTKTRGAVRIIGNVKGRRNWAYSVARVAESGKEGYEYHRITAWDAVEAGVLARDEIEDARASLPDRVFRELYLAEPGESDGRVYTNFAAENVIGDSAIDIGQPLLVGMDFNVNPMSAVVGQLRGGQLHIITEIVQRNSNTQRMSATIRDGWPKADVVVYPDPSGRARKTSSTSTDFAILESDGFVVRAPRSAPRIEDRVNTVNAGFATSDGTRRLFVDSRCQELTKALWDLYYDDKGQPTKETGDDHITDALGYLVCGVMPLTNNRAKRVKTSWG